MGTYIEPEHLTSGVSGGQLEIEAFGVAEGAAHGFVGVHWLVLGAADNLFEDALGFFLNAQAVAGGAVAQALFDERIELVDG
jgi:hypothetical protein